MLSRTTFVPPMDPFWGGCTDRAPRSGLGRSVGTPPTDRPRFGNDFCGAALVGIGPAQRWANACGTRCPKRAGSLLVGRRRHLTGEHRRIPGTPPQPTPPRASSCARRCEERGRRRGFGEGVRPPLTDDCRPRTNTDQRPYDFHSRKISRCAEIQFIAEGDCCVVSFRRNTADMLCALRPSVLLLAVLAATTSGLRIGASPAVVRRAATPCMYGKARTQGSIHCPRRLFVFPRLSGRRPVSNCSHGGSCPIRRSCRGVRSR
jgi:hypothetical protein